MKRPLKLALFSLSGLAVIGAFLWMRSLASWRPIKIGKLPPKTSVYFLSNDARTAFLGRGSRFPVILDVESGRQMEWPVNNSWAYPDEFSPSAPHRAFTLKLARRKSVGEKSVDVRDFRTQRLKRTFRWPETQFNTRFVSDKDSNRVGIIEADVFRQWDITTSKQIRQLQLDITTMPGDSASYAISSDSKRLVGCSDARCGTWDTSSGKNLCSWQINSSGRPVFFSDDARVVAYTSMFSTWSQPPVTFVDTATGKVKWTSPANSSIYCRTGSEILQLNQRGCDVLHVNTGRIKRHLPGPRQGDDILLATPEWIYTLNAKKEILRWRAR